MQGRSTVLLPALAILTATLASGRVGHAATINWKGHTWNVTAGGMAGVCQGSAANVSIDTDGYLHMKITNNGGTWTAAEIFTTDKIGFGTYQWQIDGPVDKLDKNVVVGLYPYGPQAGIGSDGQNEIDIEYARWGNASYPNGNYTVYPPTGTGSSEITFDFTLAGTYTTSRFAWSSTKIDFVTISGFEPLGSTAGLIKAWTFAPASPATQVPQQALPLGMNLWCFQGPPSNGQNVEIIVRDFAFVPLGAAIDAGVLDSGAAGGAGGTGGSGGAGGKGGAAGVDAVAGSGGTTGALGSGGVSGTGTGGISGSGGRVWTGGAVGVGGSAGNGGAAGAGTGAGTAGNPTGGAAGAAGSGGTAGASVGGSRGTSGTLGAGGPVGAMGAGGAAGASAAQPAAKASAGCSCSTAAARGGIDEQTLLVLAGLLLCVRLWRSPGRMASGARARSAKPLRLLRRAGTTTR
jgi:hypothetical protein